MNYEALTIVEIEAVLALVPAPVQEHLRRESIVLAGGSIRDTMAGVPVKDIDIFCHSEEQAERLAMGVSPFVKHTQFAYSVELHVPCGCKVQCRCFTPTVPVQYVYYKDFTTPEDLISQFDFRACCAGIYWDEAYGLGANLGATWRGVAVEGFLLDCRLKTLYFMSQLKDAGKLTALGRALKFAQRGWTLPVEQAADIIIHWQNSQDEDTRPTVDLAYRRPAVVHSFSPHYGRL